MGFFGNVATVLPLSSPEKSLAASFEGSKESSPWWDEERWARKWQDRRITPDKGTPYAVDEADIVYTCGNRDSSYRPDRYECLSGRGS